MGNCSGIFLTLGDSLSVCSPTRPFFFSTEMSTSKRKRDSVDYKALFEESERKRMKAEQDRKQAEERAASAEKQGIRRLPE